MTVRRLWVPVLGLACSVVLVIGVLSRLPASAHQLSHRRAAAQGERVIDGIPLTGGLPTQTPDFIHRVRDLTSDHEKVRVLVGPQHACSTRPGQLFWVAYQLLPRITVCDPGARYWVLIDTGPMALPTGSRVVLEPNSELRLVDTRAGAS